MLIIYVVGYPIAKLMLRNNAWYKKVKEDLRTKGRVSIGGFTFSSGGSGGGWSSGGGGSGFSGKALDNSLCDMYFDNHSQLGGNV